MAVTYNTALMYAYYSGKASELKRRLENLDIVVDMGLVSEDAVSAERAELTANMRLYEKKANALLPDYEVKKEANVA